MKDNVFVPFGKKERSLPNANHAIGCSMSETELIVRKGHMVSGYLDKNQIGASKYSILAAFEELFGGKMAANFITAITHLLHHYLKNYRGFTLSIKDVVTNPGVCEERSGKYKYNSVGLIGRQLVCLYGQNINFAKTYSLSFLVCCDFFSPQKYSTVIGLYPE
jgi:hypothetical protein